MSARTVYLHVGLPKTGTTYVQSALWQSRDRLAAAGCLIPGEKRVSGWLAASDLLGRRPRGAEAPAVEGAWNKMVEAIGRWGGDRVIFSEELLVSATRRHAQRMIRSLGSADLHVVVTVRDLARTLPSVWQQEIRKGRTWTWAEFVAAVRNPDDGPVTAGVAYWLRFDVERILSMWEGVIPPGNIHVVIVPPPASEPGVLLGRFAEAIGIDPSLLASQQPDVNTSLGVVEAEALRRLNVGLEDLNERQYARVVVQSVVPALQARTSLTRSRMPVEHQDWVAEKSDELVAFLKQRPYHVVGDLAELAPQAETGPVDNPDDLDEAELVEPIMEALIVVCRTYGQFWWRARRREGTGSTDSATLLTSRARAIGYQAKIAVLERADNNKVFGRIARAYLRRTSPDR